MSDVAEKFVDCELVYVHRDAVTSRRKSCCIVLLVAEDGEPDHWNAVVDCLELSVVTAVRDEETNSWIGEDVVLRQPPRHEYVGRDREVVIVIKPPDDRQVF